MLEAIAPEDLAARLGISDDGERPHLAPIADVVRRCIAAWGRPARQRVSGYLHRQLQAMGYSEDIVHTEVRSVIDGLLDIGDIAAVRLDGKASLVFALPRVIEISPDEHVLLGGPGGGQMHAVPPRADNAIARHVNSIADALPEITARLDFDAWIGSSGYLSHLHRRSGSESQGGLPDFWAYLTGLLERDGAPIDRQHVRGIVHPPGWRGGFFGHHNKPGGEGRWSPALPEGIWCAVRAGRNANEWHPILVDARSEHARSIDLYDWDEWAWALRARGLVVGAVERMTDIGGTLQFEQPVPLQFKRAMRLLGGSGARTWSWNMSPAARTRFRAYIDHLG